ncbi:MAG: hypothetical protein Q4F21_10760 [Lachnospiraceae bacterium]|nr:hypothetical protein [Lachnospiraceae bacterium]
MFAVIWKIVFLIASVSAAAVMAICVRGDLIVKQIRVEWIWVFIGINSMLAWCLHGNLKTSISGLALGILFWIISIGTAEKIGKGDAGMISGIGIYLGFWKTLAIVFTALLMASVYGMVLLKQKKGWTCKMAFIPFLCIPYMIAVVFLLYTGICTPK